MESMLLERWKAILDENASSIIHYLGMQVESADDREVVLSMEAGDRHLNPMGMVHGGVTATLIDTTMGCAVMMMYPDIMSVTTNLNVHYMAPLQKGKVTATARVEHSSRSTVTVTGKVTNAQGELCAMATGSFRLVP